MKSVKVDRRALNKAQRGQVIQRVMVDGWSAADAAKAFGVEERTVVAWVRKYRRHGMASLRDDASRAFAVWPLIDEFCQRLRRQLGGCKLAKNAAQLEELRPLRRR